MGRTALLACPGVQDAHPGVRGSLRGLRGDTGTLHGHSTRAAPCVCRTLPAGGISLHTECSWRTPAREHTCVCVLQEGQSQRGECWGEWRENGGTGSGCRRRHWDVPASRQKLSPCFEAVREAGSAPALTAGS